MTDQEWHDREWSRCLRQGLPVWCNEEWWQCRKDDLRDHYVHVSASDPKLLAYTQDADKGRRNIQTPVKPGRYLTRYFSDALTPKQIAFYAAWQTTGKRDNEYAN